MTWCLKGNQVQDLDSTRCCETPKAPLCFPEWGGEEKANGQCFQWLFYIPLGVRFYHSSDGIWTYGKTMLLLKPYTNISYKPSDKLSLDLTVICDESLPAALSLMAAKHYTNHRTTLANPNHLQATQNRKLSAAFNVGYKNVLDMKFGNLTLTYAQSRNGNSSGYAIQDDVINYILLPEASNNRIWQANQSFSKGFFLWNSKISESISAGTSRSNYFISGAPHKGRSNYLRANLAYNASFTEWVSFDTSNDFTLSNSQLFQPVHAQGTYCDACHKNQNLTNNMNMKQTTIILASMVMLTCAKASAQVVVSYAMDSPKFTLAHEDTDKFEQLDSSYLTISYQFKYRRFENDDELSFEDIMDLQMSRTYNAFFSRDLRNLDIKNTAEMKTTMQFTTIPENYIGFDLLTNHAERITTVTNRIPYTTQVIEYRETTPSLSWVYDSDETDTVMGYPCHVATTSFGGRNWKVYYTHDIPLPYGPWKLNGTKGLILKALDSENNFIFEAVGLTQTKQPIIRYDWNRKEMKKHENIISHTKTVFLQKSGFHCHIFGRACI